MASSRVHHHGFPGHVVTRPATTRDLDPVAELFRVSELHDRGEAMSTRSELEASWEVLTDAMDDATLVVADGPDLVGYAEVHGWRAEAVVHPGARGRGIGSALLAWTEEATLRVTAPTDEARIGQTVKDSEHEAVALFVDHGYLPRHTSWVLHLPPETVIDLLPLPEGYVVTEFDPGVHERDVYRVIEDAFNEWPNRQQTPFTTWRSWHTGRSDFDPTLSFVATADGSVIGAAIGQIDDGEGWVDQVAVHGDHRQRGIARALLRASFDRFRSRGATSVGLSTDSRTGALDLYLNVGMVVTSTYVHYSKLLRPAPGEAG